MHGTGFLKLRNGVYTKKCLESLNYGIVRLIHIKRPSVPNGKNAGEKAFSVFLLSFFLI